MNKKGFTLLELVVVMVLMGILGAMAFSRFSSKTDSAYRLVTQSVRELMNANVHRMAGDYLADPTNPSCIENSHNAGSLWLNHTLNTSTNQIRLNQYDYEAASKCNGTAGTPATTFGADTGCAYMLSNFGNIPYADIANAEANMDDNPWLAWFETVSAVDYCVFYNVASRHTFSYNFSSGELSKVSASLGSFTRP